MPVCNGVVPRWVLLDAIYGLICRNEFRLRNATTTTKADGLAVQDRAGSQGGREELEEGDRLVELGTKPEKLIEHATLRK